MSSQIVLRIRDPEGKPLAEVPVTITKRITTESDGSCTITCDPGDYWVSFKAPGFRRTKKRVRVPDGPSYLLPLDVTYSRRVWELWKSWKFLLAVGFLIINIVGLFFALNVRAVGWTWIRRALQFSPQQVGLGWPTIAALALPLISTLYFILVHWLDNNWNLAGLGDHGERDELTRLYDYAESAILRQSIHALLAAALIAPLIIEVVKPEGDSAQHMNKTVVMWFAIAGLGISTILSLVSVLCYSYSKRWKIDEGDSYQLAHALLNRGFLLDQLSWYPLVWGLVWLPAMEFPALSMLANLFFGFCLYYYYFGFGKNVAKSAR